MAKQEKDAGIKLVANNKKAYHDYFIEEKYECGIELYGTEIKSIRQGRVSVKEAYVDIENGEAFIEGMNVSPYEKGNIFNKDPLRKRKLLLHKSEILKLGVAVAQKGYTIVPLEVYLKNGRCKIQIGLARGKHAYDKRESLKKNDLKREAEQNYKAVYKG
ncbi:SsrA-binding protein [Lachnospiraceae bacterium NK3A20]|jgi:SsrA-binding protein|nr:SsrA-binding protein [Lachnospiraceae bacterium NK3A20]